MLGAPTERAAAEGNAVISPDVMSSDTLGIEIGSNAVRAVLVNRHSRDIVAAAECGILSTTDDHSHPGLDPGVIGPAIDDVLYQLGVDGVDRMVAAVTIGPDYSGVGSGPALPAWLDHQARQLGQTLVCAGDLGVAFCPQPPIDAVIAICEQADITVARIDLAPVAAARLLAAGSADTITIGSGRGWRARLRNDEVLEALQNIDIDADQPMVIVASDGMEISVLEYHDVTVAPELANSYDLNLGQLAPAVGAAVGVIDASPANLLDGEIVTGREEVVASVGSAAVYGSADTSRTTVDLQRVSARTVMPPGSETAERGVTRTASGGSGVDIEGSAIDLDELNHGGGGRGHDTGDGLNGNGSTGYRDAALATTPERLIRDDETGPMLIERSVGEGFGRGRSEFRQTGSAVDDDDLINIFSPDPESERELVDDRRRLPAPLLVLAAVLIVAGVVYFLVL